MGVKEIDFLKYRKIAYLISIFLIISSLVLLFTKGLNLGLDFTGGTVIEVRFKESVNIGDLRKKLSDGGLSAFSLQRTGEGTVIIKLRIDQDPSKALKVLEDTGDYELIRRESIGAVVSEELRSKAVWAIVVALIGILIYLGFRFEPLWGAGAILALVHDVLIVLGAYSLFHREVNLEVVSAFLIVAGYSVADTVVIYDRIRENLRVRKNLPFYEIVNISVNQTLSRTIMTSLTTFATSLALFILGGHALSNIMFAFVVGVIVGTFSSVFVASSFVNDVKGLLGKGAKETSEEA